MSFPAPYARVVLTAAITLLAASCTQPLDEEAVHEDWCQRAEAAMAAYQHYGPLLPDDLAALSEEERLDYEEATQGVAADPIPQTISESMAVMRGDADLPEDPILADEEFFAAVEEVGSYAQEECGIVVDDDASG